jgi:hypothetical protein
MTSFTRFSVEDKKMKRRALPLIVERLQSVLSRQGDGAKPAHRGTAFVTKDLAKFAGFLRL